MRRLLQFGTILFIYLAVLAPLLEVFDDWDPAGLTNDTEITVFFIALFTVLSLLVVHLIAMNSLLRPEERMLAIVLGHDSTQRSCRALAAFLKIPPSSSPLRI